MPRSNRSRRDGRKNARPWESDSDLDVERLRAGFRRTETHRGSLWNVQPMSATATLKEYTCPGCSQTISEGVAHLVVWRADGIMGEAADLAARRHWHSGCWKAEG